MNIMDSILVRGRFGLFSEYTPVYIGSGIRTCAIQSFIAAISRVRSQTKLEFVPLKIAEGAFSEIWVHEDLCARFTDAHEGLQFLERAATNLSFVISHKLFPIVHSYGWLKDNTGGTKGLVLFMERLERLESPTSDLESLIYNAASQVAYHGFHNDLKIDNIMIRKNGEICIIDYDLFDPNKIRICVNSFSFIELDFTELGANSHQMQLLRLFYDYSYLSLSIMGTNPLYLPILQRLVGLFNQLKAEGVLDRVQGFLGPERMRDLPIEILARCDIDAVSVNLFDLKGNAFAHKLEAYDQYPSLIRSNGVYWPRET